VLTFCILYGFSSGAFISLLVPIAFSPARGPGEFGARLGFVFIALALAALVGTPVRALKPSSSTADRF
jgi:hypothetical protein